MQIVETRHASSFITKKPATCNSKNFIHNFEHLAFSIYNLKLKYLIFLISVCCNCLFTVCVHTGEQKAAILQKEEKTDTVKEPNAVEAELLEFINDVELQNASIGFYAIDMSSGDVIAQHDPDLSLVPASTMKLVTTATALEMLGSKFHFRTTVEYDGKIDSARVLHGNIYIKGGGDPALGSEYFKNVYLKPHFMEKWVKAIQDLGIDSVDGAVIGDARIFDINMIPHTWIWGDIGNYFGSGPCGLTVYDNKYDVYFKSGAKNGDSTWITRIEPDIPGISFINKVKASSVMKDMAFIYGYPYDTLRLITGSIPKGKDEFIIKGSIPDPPYLVAKELEGRLKDAGINCSMPATTIRKITMTQELPDSSRTKITVTYSPKLEHIIFDTNHKSLNLWAEHLLNYFGVFKYNCGDTFSGTKALTAFWKSKGMDTKGMYVNDGSGLSRYNGITVKHLVAILRYMKNESDHFDAFYKSLPIAGKTGTIKSICRGTVAQNNLRAKSGYMSRVRSYAGYVTTVSERDIAFAVIVNNFNCTPYQIKKKIEGLLVKLAELKE